MTTELVDWQNEPGIKATVAPDFTSVKVAGVRENNTYWNDNPIDDYTSGVSAIPGNILNSGALDFDLAPECDNAGKNCSFGIGTGYKGFVGIRNTTGESVKIGIIHDDNLSPNNLTIMVEGSNNSGIIRRYLQPDLLPANLPHHFRLLWETNSLSVKVDHSIILEPIPIDGVGIGVTFAASARYKNDAVTLNFRDINFSWGSVVTPQYSQ